MRIYKKTEKNALGWGYWGDFSEIDMGWSDGLITDNSQFTGEKLHYHKTGTVYFLSVDGTGLIQVEGKEVELPKNTLLRIDPGEKYKVLGANEVPFRWIVVCTSKERSEKVDVE